MARICTMCQHMINQCQLSISLNLKRRQSTTLANRIQIVKFTHCIKKFLIWRDG